MSVDLQSIDAFINDLDAQAAGWYTMLHPAEKAIIPPVLGGPPAVPSRLPAYTGPSVDFSTPATVSDGGAVLTPGVLVIVGLVVIGIFVLRGA